MSIRLTVELSIKEGHADTFQAAAGPAMARVRAEDKGCEAYELFRSCDDDTRFVIVESWATEADMEAHGTTPAMGAVGKAFKGNLAGKPVMAKY